MQEQAADSRLHPLFSNPSGRHKLRAILNKLQLACKAIEHMERAQALGKMGIAGA